MSLSHFILLFLKLYLYFFLSLFIYSSFPLVFLIQLSLCFFYSTIRFRQFYSDPTVWFDSTVFSFFTGWFIGKFYPWPIIISLYFSKFYFTSTFSSFIPVNLFTSLISVFVCLYLLRPYFTPLFPLSNITSTSSKSSSSHNSRIVHPIPRPKLLKARVTHTRLLPSRHTFIYPYLLVVVPVGFSGRCGLVSIDNTHLSCQKSSPSWFHVNPKNYLLRRPYHEKTSPSLYSKLRDFLQQNNVSRSIWHYAYLVTAPQILGYSFNPVSFWYLYNESNQLVLLILEVNNTFDERRIYLLHLNNSTSSTTTPSEPSSSYTYSWQKDFFVSPFNSDSGLYKLSATSLQCHSPCTNLWTFKLDNLIQLKPTNYSANFDPPVTLLARITSVCPPVDPESLSFLQQVKLLLSWAWLGFLTFPRILRQAFSLYFLRKLPFNPAPAINFATIARRATQSEQFLHTIFARYLQYIVESLPIPEHNVYNVHYEPPHAMGDSQTFTRSSCPAHMTTPKEYHPSSCQDNSAKCLSIKVLSPTFYSRMIHYNNVATAVLHEAFLCDKRSRTLHVSDESLALDFVNFIRSHESSCAPDKPYASQAIDTPKLLKWKYCLIKLLRVPPIMASYPTNIHSFQASCDAPIMEKCYKLLSDVTSTFAFSDLDEFILTMCTEQDILTYRYVLLKSFIATRFCRGQLWILSSLDALLRTVVILAWYLAMSKYITNRRILVSFYTVTRYERLAQRNTYMYDEANLWQISCLSWVLGGPMFLLGWSWIKRFIISSV